MLSWLLPTPVILDSQRGPLVLPFPRIHVKPCLGCWKLQRAEPAVGQGSGYPHDLQLGDLGASLIMSKAGVKFSNTCPNTHL